MVGEPEKYWGDIAAKASKHAQTSHMFAVDRAGKITGSNFASIVPKTKEYIGHIIEQWGYPDFKYNEKYNCGGQRYESYIADKMLEWERAVAYVPPNPEEAHLVDPDIARLLIEEKINSSIDPRNPMQKGNNFEPVIRNLTSQIYGVGIHECGFIRGHVHPFSGVSPDGVLMEVNPRAFEAKTVVSRKMERRVPIKYHIQMDKVCNEIGASGTVYTEVRFSTMSPQSWHTEFRDYNDNNPRMPDGYCPYGVYTVDPKNGERIYPPAACDCYSDFLDWLSRPFVKACTPHNLVFFKVEELWTTEIKLPPHYKELYEPLIIKHAKYLERIQTTDEGLNEWRESRKRKACAEDETNEGGEAATAKKQKRTPVHPAAHDFTNEATLTCPVELNCQTSFSPPQIKSHDSGVGQEGAEPEKNLLGNPECGDKSICNQLGQPC